MKKLVTTSIIALCAATVFVGCAKGQREAVCVCAEDYGADWDDCDEVLKAKVKGDCGTVKEDICLDPKDRTTCKEMDVDINCDGVDGNECKAAIKDLADCVEFTGCVDQNCYDEWKTLDADCGVRVWQYCVGANGMEPPVTTLPADAATNPASTCLQGAFFDIAGAI